jgi:hypothetical protein
MLLNEEAILATVDIPVAEDRLLMEDIPITGPIKELH